MARYLATFEANESLTPSDPKEFGALISKLAEITKQSMKEGKTSDWGMFLGGGKGYIIFEGTAHEMFQEAQKYSSNVHFYVQEVLSIDDLLRGMGVAPSA